MKNLKELTIIHSNDLHGDFMVKEENNELLGGVSMLSGYVSKVRKEEKNVVYVIAGDMFRGSIIDSEYKGISTIEIMNMLSPDQYTHPARNRETELGKLFSDVIRDALGVDIVFLGSGSIRYEELGPIVLYQDLIEILPYNDEVYRVYATGQQLRRMIRHVLREEAFSGHTEFYQFSRGFRIEYNRPARELISLSLNGLEIKDDDHYKIALQKFHLNSIEDFLAVSLDEVSSFKKPKLLTTNETDLIEEYLIHHEMIRAPEERRLIIL